MDAGSVEAMWALAQYFRELEQRFVGGFDSTEALAEVTATLNPPSGLFVVATLEDEIVGCGAILWIDDITAEIKRMWIDQRRRGMGLGTRLLGHLESEVLTSGRARVVLDTNDALGEAIGMYRGLGYTPTERYNDNPYAHRWFVKSMP